jgi:ribosomal protein S18 acetylase RimI-like enzyme
VPAQVELRPLALADRAPLASILQASGAFTVGEVAVALELIDLGLQAKDHGYRFVVADAEGRAVGYACYGEAPCTEGTYDLYWIAVEPALRGTGVGRALLRAVEEAVWKAGGRMLLVETASKESYAATRAFYERNGYVVAARVTDFYRPGDDKLIYRRTPPA